MSFYTAGVGQFLSLKTCFPSKSPSVNKNRIRCGRNASQKPNKPKKNRPWFSFKKLTITAASGVLSYVVYKKTSQISIGGGATGGGGGRGGGGGGGGDGGGVWNRLMSPAADEDEHQSREWDEHGVAAGIVLQLKKLSASKKYMVSAINLFDRLQNTVVGSEDLFYEFVSLKAGGVYTKAQLQKELETLNNCGMFDRVDLEAMTNPDGTIAITVPFVEYRWKEGGSFRCMNVGLMPPLEALPIEDNMSVKDQAAYLRRLESLYRERMWRARPCMLPSSVEREILQMLWDGGVVPRVLHNIRDRVQKWYHDEGYACAQVVDFGNLHTDDPVVCEVVEGDITKVVIQIEDKHGNACEKNSLIEVVKGQLPQQLEEGNVFNMKAGREAVSKLQSLSLFSEIEVSPKHDDKEEGGFVVEIKLKELHEGGVESKGDLIWEVIETKE